MLTSQFRLTGDQAVALRQMVRDAKMEEPQAEVSETLDEGRMIVVSGAKGGVGATTLALRLAEAYSRHTAVTLVDANLRQADLAQVARVSVEGRQNLATVLAGLCRTEEALQPIQENLSLLPGAWAPGSQPDATSESVGRWLEDLKRLVADGKTVILDAGVGIKPWTEPLWRAATHVALVTTPNRVSVLDAYATTKLARGEGVKTPIRLLVNRAAAQPQADRVHASFDSTCQRFLGESLGLLCWAPDDAAFAEGTPDEDSPQVAERWLEQFGPTARAN